MRKHQTTTNYEQMGIAALLPGLIFAGELIQTRIRELQDQLAGVMNGNGAISNAVKRGPGRPAGTVATGGNSGWPTDPEERKTEALRRQQVAREKKLAEESHAKRVAAGKKRWVGLTAKQKAEHLKKMRAGRTNGKANRGGAASPNHPSNPNHPQHEAFREKMRITAASRRAAA